MPLPRWLPEFLQKEAGHLKLAANYIEGQSVSVPWQQLVQRVIDRDRRLAEILEKAARSGSESDMLRAWEFLLDLSSSRMK